MGSFSLIIGYVMFMVLIVTLFITGIVKLVMYVSGKPVFTPRQSARRIIFVELAIIFGSIISGMLRSLSAFVPKIYSYLVSDLISVILMLGIAFFLFAKFLKKRNKEATNDTSSNGGAKSKLPMNQAFTLFIWTMVIELPLNALKLLFELIRYM